MGKVKELLNDKWFMDRDYRYDVEYQEWESSEGYVSFVNEELFDTKPIYSRGEIVDALQYASKSIIIEPDEVGKEIYNRLFSEKVVEYLNNLNE